MRMMKKASATLLLLAMCIGLAACKNTDEESSSAFTQEPGSGISEGTEANAEGDIYTPGTYLGTAQGFKGEITVTIVVDSQKITSVTITGDQETEGVGSRAIEQMPEQILAAQSAEVDGVTGATFSSDGVRAALQAALNQAMGMEESNAVVKMVPGTYETAVAGFSKTTPIEVEVTVSEDRITGIELGYNKENVGILQSVEDLLIPRMIENQSVNIDAICGATISSNAVEKAVEECLTQALAAAGTDESAIRNFYNVPETEENTQELTVDVVVVGMGGTGTAAAMKAAEQQLENGSAVSVLAIDKAGKFGGTACNTSSMLAFNSNITQDEFNGGEDYYVLGEVDADLRANVPLTDKSEIGWNLELYQSGTVVDWLIGHGFYFGEPTLGFAGDFPTLYNYTGDTGEACLSVAYSYFQSMVDDYTACGGQYMLETEGTELIYDETEERVIGIKAVNHVTGTEYTIYADAVVLATGGFGGNPEMEETLFEGYQKGAWANDIGMIQNDGKMVQEALDLGAGTAGMENPMGGNIYNIGVPTHLTCYDVVWEEGTYDSMRDDTGAWSLNDVPEMMVNDWDGLFINPEGERFVNEAMPFAGKYNNGPVYYSLWSQDLLDYVEENGFSSNYCGNFITTSSIIAQIFPLNVGVSDLGGDVYEIMEKCVEAGNAIKADTLEELAAAAGMDPETLINTVKRYDEACLTGVDEDFGKDASYLHAVGEEGPFYLLIGKPRSYTSGGGLDVSEQMEVLWASDGSAIKGLYAAGTDCLGMVQSVYYGGEYLSWAFISGYVAGENAADYAATLQE